MPFRYILAAALTAGVAWPAAAANTIPLPPISAAAQVAEATPTSGVRDIQQLLNQRGFDAGPVDGVIGERTRRAIRQYQSRNGLEVTGEPTPALYAHLRGGPSTPAAVSTPPSRDLIVDVQTALNQRGYDVGAADGALGPRTRAAIRAFQTAAGLPVTGAVTPELLQSIREGGPGAGQPGHGGTQAGSPSTPGPEAGTPAAGTALIADIERELLRHGYPVGAVDGQLDDQSRAAILRYQADAHLPETGEPTPELLAHLRTSEVSAGPQAPEGAAQDAVQGLTRGLIERMERRNTSP